LKWHWLGSHVGVLCTW